MSMMMRMTQSMETNREAMIDIGILLLRIVVGITFLVAGYLKLTGGPAGFGGFLGSLGVPLPGLFAWIVTLVELLGGLALILGIGTRIAAPLLVIDMFFAIVLVKGTNGFQNGDGGYQFELLLLAACLLFALAGAGKLSGDKMFLKNKFG